MNVIAYIKGKIKINTNEVRIETSTLCNFSCKFCPNKNGFKRKKEIMSLELFTKLLYKIKAEAPEITTCTFSGMGEPLLDNTIEDKIKLAKKLHYNIILLTNGSLLSYKKIKDIDLLKISFSTFSRERFKKLTGKDDFYIVLDNIYHVAKTHKVIITATLTENFEEEIEGLKKLFDNKVYALEIWKPHNWGNWGNYRLIKSQQKKLVEGLKTGQFRFKLMEQLICVVLILMGSYF